jgi:hypothetical protein
MAVSSNEALTTEHERPTYQPVPAQRPSDFEPADDMARLPAGRSDFVIFVSSCLRLHTAHPSVSNDSCGSIPTISPVVGLPENVTRRTTDV